jgi:DNA invertase Pin-like site-specific DNA recombinase
MKIPEDVKRWVKLNKKGIPLTRIARDEGLSYSSLYVKFKYYTDPEYREILKNAVKKYREKPEVKEKMSEYKKNRYATDPKYRETRKKYREKPEVKEKMSEYQKNRCAAKTKENKEKRLEKLSKLKVAPDFTLSKINDRTKAYIEMRQAGKTFQEIADHFGVTKQTVNQCIKKYTKSGDV